jgi:hypothetical protein
LARLRHPSILEVVEPVSESRSSIVFVTEPLLGSLTHLVKSNDTYSSDSQAPSLDLDELEARINILPSIMILLLIHFLEIDSKRVITGWKGFTILERCQSSASQSYNGCSVCECQSRVMQVVYSLNY